MKNLLIFALVLGCTVSAFCEDGQPGNPPPKVIGPDGKELSQEQSREFLSKLGGVGVAIELVAEGVVVRKVLPDTPACAAGMKADDIITEVDSKPVRGLKLPEVVQQLRGPVGSQVALTLLRKPQVEPLKVNLVRKEIRYYKDRPDCKGST